jgi:hypothetical protein
MDIFTVMVVLLLCNGILFFDQTLTDFWAGSYYKIDCSQATTAATTIIILILFTRRYFRRASKTYNVVITTDAFDSGGTQLHNLSAVFEGLDAMCDDE